jgi:hypothetical protein
MISASPRGTWLGTAQLGFLYSFLIRWAKINASAFLPFESSAAHSYTKGPQNNPSVMAFHNETQPWLPAFVLAVVLIYLSLALNIIILILQLRERKGQSGRRSHTFLLLYPRTFFSFVYGQCIAGVVTITILSVLSNFQNHFLSYIAAIGLYFSLSGEVRMIIRGSSAAII